MNDRIEKLEKRVRELESKLADSMVFTRDFAEFAAHTAMERAIRVTLDRIEKALGKKDALKLFRELAA